MQECATEHLELHAEAIRINGRGRAVSKVNVPVRLRRILSLCASFDIGERVTLESERRSGGCYSGSEVCGARTGMHRVRFNPERRSQLPAARVCSLPSDNERFVTRPSQLGVEQALMSHQSSTTESAVCTMQ